MNILILGAGGAFGSACASAAEAAGHTVTRADRSRIDIFDTASLATAFAQADAVINGLNPPYKDWDRDVLRYTTAVLEAAEKTDRPVLVAGNVYNFGSTMPPVLDADTPRRLDTSLGRIRETMEAAFRASRARTIVLRCGDFMGETVAANWFDTYIAAKAHQGRFTYPGPRDVTHAWTWLPDAARAAIALLKRVDDLPNHTDVAVPSLALTGDELKALCERTLAKPLKGKSFPWPMLRLMSPFSGDIRGVLEMRYLWNTPHEIDGDALTALLPDHRRTDNAAVIEGALKAIASQA